MKNDRIISRLEGKSSSGADEYQKAAKVALAGNPNVGKSLFFNHFSGMYADVSNFPGTTVSVSSAKYKNYEIFDTPGIYGVSSFNEEERVAKKVIVNGDIILNIVNGFKLERDLFLTLQLIEMGKKVTLIVNFWDEIKRRNIFLDVEKLSELLGIEVITTSAVTKEGFDKLDYAIENAREGKIDDEVLSLIEKTVKKTGDKTDAVLILEGDSETAEKHGLEPGTPNDREMIYIGRRNRISEIIDQTERENTPKAEFANKLGRLALNPLTGIPILLVILTAVYFFIGDFVSQRVVNFTEIKIGKELFEYNVKSFVAGYAAAEVTVEIPGAERTDEKTFLFPKGMNARPDLKSEFETFSSKPDAVLHFQFNNPFVEIVFGEFGVVTMSITYLFFLLLPLVMGFYFVMALLEDSGYLPRLSTMLDKSLSRIGLNGKAIIPILLGFGCITMANITTRILGTNRERTIVTAILQFAIPCSAQLAVIAAMLSGLGAVPILIYITTMFILFVSLSTILDKLIPGESSPLLIDLPTMALPRMKNVLQKTWFRSYGFMREAGSWFVVGSLAVGIFKISGLLTAWQNLLEPVTVNWLKLPKEAANAFIMGIVRRDFGAAGLFDMNLTPEQVTVALITITVFVPCIASFVVMLKERGWKEGMTVWAGTWIAAFLVGGIVAQIII
ncbi:MAG: ferrous iron transporter B [Chlorobi bacterium]|nr:ferrous iron transporter B [Chlorobiota bacterium]